MKNLSKQLQFQKIQSLSITMISRSKNQSKKLPFQKTKSLLIMTLSQSEKLVQITPILKFHLLTNKNLLIMKFHSLSPLTWILKQILTKMFHVWPQNRSNVSRWFSMSNRLHFMIPTQFMRKTRIKLRSLFVPISPMKSNIITFPRVISIFVIPSIPLARVTFQAPLLRSIPVAPILWGNLMIFSCFLFYTADSLTATTTHLCRLNDNWRSFSHQQQQQLQQRIVTTHRLRKIIIRVSLLTTRQRR